MNFTGLKIPEGEVVKIRTSDGTMLWRKGFFNYKVYAKTIRDVIDNLDETGFLNKNGTVTSNTGWKASDYMPCEPGIATVVSNGTSPAICFYDKDKNFISGVAYNNESPKEVVIPPRAYFFRCSVANNAVLGAYVTIPYSNPTELFKASLVDKVINIQGEIVTDYVTGSYNYTGEVNGIGIPCEGKSTVNFSGFGATATRLLACFYDSNDSAIASTRTKPNAVSGSLSIPEGAAFVRFSYYYTVGATKLTNAFKDFTINIE